MFMDYYSPETASVELWGKKKPADTIASRLALNLF
jgi:hypothetical protein